MKKVMQTMFPTDGEPMRGDCLRACVASIFECPIDEVPHFCEHRNWEELLDEWLGQYGLAHVFIRINVETSEGYLGCIDGGVWLIVSGTTKRHPTRLHSVVARTLKGGVRWEYQHDPHPSGAFLEDAKDLLFFIQREPWAQRKEHELRSRAADGPGEEVRKWGSGKVRR